MKVVRAIRRFFGLHYRLPILLGISLHLVWGFSLVVNNDIAPLTIFGGLHKFLELGISPFLLGITILTFALFALVGSFFESQLTQQKSFLLILPQYFILIVAFLTDLLVLVDGKNPTSGTPVDRTIIISILWPVMGISLAHTFAVIERWIFMTREVLK